jgi:hypothetical protein
MMHSTSFPIYKSHYNLKRPITLANRCDKMDLSDYSCRTQRRRKSFHIVG